MKFRASGEINPLVEDSFRETMNLIRKEIGYLLLSSLYGNGLTHLDAVIVISSGTNLEKFQYNPETRSTNIRVVIDFDTFKNADSSGRKKLIYEALIRSVYIVTENFDIQNFDSTKLIKDLSRLKEEVF